MQRFKHDNNDDNVYNNNKYNFTSFESFLLSLNEKKKTPLNFSYTIVEVLLKYRYPVLKILPNELTKFQLFRITLYSYFNAQLK